MTKEVISNCQQIIAYLEAKKGCLTIDADVHASDLSQLSGELRKRYEASPDYYHGRPISAEDILAEMAMAGVDMALIWQNPAATFYTDTHQQNFESLLAANRYVLESARRYPMKFIPAGWVDPNACGLDGALRMAETLVKEFGFLFIKMNPAQNRFPIDSDPVCRVTEQIVTLGAIPAFHFGADTTFTPADGLEVIAAMIPTHPVLAVHMGGGGAGYVEADELYIHARELGLRRANIRFALSAKRDTHIESDLITYQIAGEPFCRNLFCASDAPYGRMTWNFGGFRAMFQSLQDGATHTDPRLRKNPRLFTDYAVQGYMGRNFAELTVAGYRHLLHTQGVQMASD